MWGEKELQSTFVANFNTLHLHSKSICARFVFCCKRSFVCWQKLLSRKLYLQRTSSSVFTVFLFFIFQTHLTFGKEFTQAVELKQVAQQEAERARFLVEKVRNFKLLSTQQPLFPYPKCSHNFILSPTRSGNIN